MNGERYYLSAIALTDANPGVTFKEAISHDARVSQVERLYFTGEWRDLDLMGWNTFSMKMEQADQKKWLAKIKELDGNVVLDHLESQLMQASRDGKAPNRALLEATVKALQGVVALNKVTNEAELASAVDGIEVVFVPSLKDPIEPEDREAFFARIKEEILQKNHEELVEGDPND